MNKLHHRIKQHSKLSIHLTGLNNEKLAKILAEAKPMHEGIGGKSALVFIDKTPVFVKKVPLTNLEQCNENFMSTANIFDLPLCYQYGIGSAGFGAWRELAAHIMTTNWVISGECPNFPMMYHWRMFPTHQSDQMNFEQQQKLNRDVLYWENSDSIRHRLQTMYSSSAHICLFLEYIPQNLFGWLSGQINKSSNTAAAAVHLVDHGLAFTNSFMRERGFIHFDAHFENILTDGESLYFSDFGLGSVNKI